MIVLDDPATVAPGVRTLFDLLDRPHQNRISIVNSHYRWSLDPAGTVLTLAVRAHEPTRVDLDIVMPAQPLLGIFSLLPSGVTFAITTKRRADKLTERVAIRDALHEILLLVSPARSGNPVDGFAALRKHGKRSAHKSPRWVGMPPGAAPAHLPQPPGPRVPRQSTQPAGSTGSP